MCTSVSISPRGVAPTAATAWQSIKILVASNIRASTGDRHGARRVEGRKERRKREAFMSDTANILSHSLARPHACTSRVHVPRRPAQRRIAPNVYVNKRAQPRRARHTAECIDMRDVRRLGRGGCRPGIRLAGCLCYTILVWAGEARKSVSVGTCL